MEDDYARAIITLDQYISGKADSIVSRKLARSVVRRVRRKYNLTSLTWADYKRDREKS